MSKVIIRPDLTIKRFGYDDLSLLAGSAKLVVTECLGCGDILEREHRSATKNHRCPILRELNGTICKRCYYCCKWQPLTCFNPVSTETGGVSKLCKSCRKIHPAVRAGVIRQRQRIRQSLAEIDQTKYINYRTKQIQTRAKSKSLPCDIDKTYMLDVWNSQHGLCYYTGIKMDGLPASGRSVWNSPSIDRLTPELGYTRDNVVWCLMAINAFKGELNESEFKEIVVNAKWWTS